MENYLRLKDGSIVRGIDFTDLKIFSLIAKILKDKDEKEYLIVRYQDIVRNTGIDIDENELFARLQKLVNENLLKSEKVSVNINGKVRSYLGFKLSVRGRQLLNSI